MPERRHDARGAMIVLGIDPGTASTGWGAIEQEGNKMRSLGRGCIEIGAVAELARAQILGDFTNPVFDVVALKVNWPPLWDHAS